MDPAEPYSLLARDYDDELGDIFDWFHRPLFDHFLTHYLPDRGRALDLACGTGRIACYLAEHGFEVTGLDRSAAMLEIARSRAGADRISWVEGDMRNFALPERYDLVTCNFDSMNQLLAPAAVRELLALVARHLVPGGYFVCDVLTRHALEHLWPQLTRVVEHPDYFAIWRGRFDGEREEGVLTADYFLLESTGTYSPVRETHREKAFDDNKLQEWFEAAGMPVREIRADDKWEPPTATTDRIAYFCRRD